MPNNTPKSGYQVGCEYAEKLNRYLKTVDTLPARNGKINKSAVATAVGIPRESLYTNPACVELLDLAIKKKKLAHHGDKETMKLERRVNELEQKNASLLGEVFELRRKIKRYRHIEAMLEQGQRIIP